jgi:ATP-dependent RNA helicase DDX19/DBP5
MESNAKKEDPKVELNSDKNKIENNIVESQFEKLAIESSELREEIDKAVLIDPKKAEGIENPIKDENELFIKDATWEGLGIRDELMKGCLEMGFMMPSKIQSTTFPLIMKKPYSHLIAQSPNGSGKTGAFSLGVLSRIDENKKAIQAVILAHTRELVNQITDKTLIPMAKYTKITVTSLLATNKEVEAGQVIVCTPGNFNTLFLQRKIYSMDNIQIIVLDEADYMITNENTSNIIDKMFNYFIKKNLPIQVLFFSATYTEDNFKVIKKYFKRAIMLEMKKEALTLKNVRQLYFKCNKRDEKVEAVEDYLKRSLNMRVIIFVNTRDFTERLSSILRNKGYKVFILMGGNMDPKERDETIKRFNKGDIQILITTNVLARGFDERLVNLVINFDLPVKQEQSGQFVADVETYLHRIGRTGRFGARGVGLTLISSDKELKQLQDIENYYGTKIEEIKSMDDLLEELKKFLEEKF